MWMRCDAIPAQLTPPPTAAVWRRWCAVRGWAVVCTSPSSSSVVSRQSRSVSVAHAQINARERKKVKGGRSQEKEKDQEVYRNKNVTSEFLRRVHTQQQQQQHLQLSRSSIPLYTHYEYYSLAYVSFQEIFIYRARERTAAYSIGSLSFRRE
ncbi:hypothetical protein DFH27DRAFT_598291 [Peziza echinospora]|nr:hypothetical protein DFH27DRAFT_598291 [Peziza echinospora]